MNARHPDFAEFAVSIGRALGREQECISALKSAEADKAVFCLENDPLGVALLHFLKETKEFTGNSADLLTKLLVVDTELGLSAKSLGKRLSSLWPHLEKLFPTAKRDKDRKGFAVFSFGMP